MASALVDDNLDDISNKENSKNKSNLNYPGPDPKKKYPLTVVYCGGINFCCYFTF
jgi:hypothetical protein